MEQGVRKAPRVGRRSGGPAGMRAWCATGRRACVRQAGARGARLFADRVCLRRLALPDEVAVLENLPLLLALPYKVAVLGFGLLAAARPDREEER